MNGFMTQGSYKIWVPGDHTCRGLEPCSVGMYISESQIVQQSLSFPYPEEPMVHWMKNLITQPIVQTSNMFDVYPRKLQASSFSPGIPYKLDLCVND